MTYLFRHGRVAGTRAPLCRFFLRLRQIGMSGTRPHMKDLNLPGERDAGGRAHVI